MKDIMVFAEKVRKRTAEAIEEYGEKDVREMLGQPRSAVDRVRAFVDGDLQLGGAMVRAAYRYYKACPELYEGIDPSPITMAGDFFVRPPKRVLHGRGKPVMEASGFLASMFGWSGQGHKIHVPYMPDHGAAAAINRIAYVLDIDPEELMYKLRDASMLRKAAMTACREVDGVEY